MDSLASLQLLATVPTLEVDGSNWATFRGKFKAYIDSTGLDEHFLEENVPAEGYEMIKAKPVKQQDESDEDHQKHKDVWKDGGKVEERRKGVEEGRCQGQSSTRKLSPEFNLHGNPRVRDVPCDVGCSRDLHRANHPSPKVGFIGPTQSNVLQQKG